MVVVVWAACSSPKAATDAGIGSGDDAEHTSDAMADAMPDAPPPWVAPATPSDLASAYVKASNPDIDDRFGYVVALSGDGTTMAVGAPDEKSGTSDPTNNGMMTAGAVYIYTWSTSGWAFQSYLKASTPGMGDQFGMDLSLSGDGNTLVVGAPGEDSCAVGVDGTGTLDSCGDTGALYVFERSGTSWAQTTYIKPSNTFYSGAFGHEVAIARDGRTIVVGAPGDKSNGKGVGGTQNDNSAFWTGAALVFVRTSTSWAQQAYIKATNAGGNDFFGRSVAISADGNVVAVGAIGEASQATGVGGAQTDNSFSYAGATYVFRRAGVTWTQEAYLKASNTGDGDEFGTALSLSALGDTLVVTAYGEDSNSASDPTNNSQLSAGAVYVFTKASTWSQQAYLKRAAPTNGDYLGLAVALSADGNRLVVGSVGDDTTMQGIDPAPVGGLADSSGAAEVYDRSGTTWSRTHVIKATNTGAFDIFGEGVAITADGTAIAVGAANEQSAAVGIDGNQADNAKNKSGAVYVYNLP